jgi:hypothetical protein
LFPVGSHEIWFGRTGCLFGKEGLDSDSTESVYGRNVSFKAILQGKVATPEIAREFMKAVRETAHKAKVQEARDEKK